MDSEMEVKILISQSNEIMIMKQFLLYWKAKWPNMVISIYGKIIPYSFASQTLHDPYTS